jgi:hypothetical protein
MESRTRKQSLIWGSLLIFFGIVALVETYTDLTDWVWVAILAAGGLVVFGVYLTDRSEGWLLIPAYVMWAIAGLIALIALEILRDEAIATFVMAAIALPFLVVFLRDREQWWALIPAYVLLAIGVMVGLIGLGVLDDLLVPAYIMFVIGIPFLVVYARNTANWWALIPGGIMVFMGLAFLVAETAIEYVGPVALILVGVWVLVRQFIRRGPVAPDA